MAQLSVARFSRTKESTERITNFHPLSELIILSYNYYCFKKLKIFFFWLKFLLHYFLKNCVSIEIFFTRCIIFMKEHWFQRIVKSMVSLQSIIEIMVRSRAADGQFRRAIVSQLIINNYLVFSVLSCTVFNYPLIRRPFYSR